MSLVSNTKVTFHLFESLLTFALRMSVRATEPKSRQKLSAQKVGFLLIPERRPKSAQKRTFCAKSAQKVRLCMLLGVFPRIGGSPTFGADSFSCDLGLWLELKYTTFAPLLSHFVCRPPKVTKLARALTKASKGPHCRKPRRTPFRFISGEAFLGQWLISLFFLKGSPLKSQNLETQELEDFQRRGGIASILWWKFSIFLAQKDLAL